MKHQNQIEKLDDWELGKLEGSSIMSIVYKVNELIDAHNVLRTHVINTEKIEAQNKIVGEFNATLKDQGEEYCDCPRGIGVTYNGLICGTCGCKIREGSKPYIHPTEENQEDTKPTPDPLERVKKAIGKLMDDVAMEDNWDKGYYEGLERALDIIREETKV